MTELEQLRADLATLKETSKIYLGAYGYFPAHHDLLIKLTEEKIADLEAQQAAADKWADSRMFVQEILADSSFPQRLIWLARYARHLESKVAELDHELRCERIDGGKVRDDLRARIAEMEQHGRKVDQANHEHYGRLQDQIAIRDLKIEKLEGQLAGRPVSEAAEALVKEMDEFKQRETLAEQEIWIRDAKLTVDFIVRNRPNGNPTACDIAHYARHLEDQLNVATIRNLRTVERLREKLAELTTIYNAIPPACGLARELVERRIEGVKKEMQGNGKG